MSAIGELLIVFGTVFVASYLAARALTLSRPSRAGALQLCPDARMKLLCPSGSYRCSIVALRDSGFVVTPPLHRDAFVPLRVGDSLVAQIPQPGALLTFKTTILRRDPVSHEFMLAYPQHYRRTDRRLCPRDHSFQGVAAKLNGVASELVDLSAEGARILTHEATSPGDRVSLDLPEGFSHVFAYVLETQPASLGGVPAQEVRLRLEEPLMSFKRRHLRSV